MTTATKTYHDGANDERTAILAKVRRMLKKSEDRDEALPQLEQWLLARVKRNKAKKGGL